MWMKLSLTGLLQNWQHTPHLQHNTLGAGCSIRTDLDEVHSFKKKYYEPLGLEILEFWEHHGSHGLANWSRLCVRFSGTATSKWPCC